MKIITPPTHCCIMEDGCGYYALIWSHCCLACSSDSDQYIIVWTAMLRKITDYPAVSQSNTIFEPLLIDRIFKPIKKSEVNQLEAPAVAACRAQNLLSIWSDLKYCIYSLHSLSWHCSLHFLIHACECHDPRLVVLGATVDPADDPTLHAVTPHCMQWLTD